MNYTLIGMAGSGKSTVGKLLAVRLGNVFVDTDRLLEAEHGVGLPVLVASLSREAFLAEEARVVLRAASSTKPFVVSPGGSIIYSPAAMQRLQEVSCIIYLRTPLDLIKQRIGAVPRGIVFGPGQSLETLYAERLPLYEQWAALTVEGGGEAEEVLEMILRNR